jgi:hypothetical protein
MPRAFKHLSKRADEKDKASLMKLIKVWEERKVFGHSLPPAIRESLLGTASEEKEERGAKRGAIEMLAGTMGGVAAAYKALESAEAQEARVWTRVCGAYGKQQSSPVCMLTCLVLACAPSPCESTHCIFLLAFCSCCYFSVTFRSTLNN